jgi:hypothetical protein
MLEQVLGSAGACWICDGRTQPTGVQRLGRDIRRAGSPVSQRAVMDEFVCRSCGAVEWLETVSRFIESGAPARPLSVA